MERDFTAFHVPWNWIIHTWNPSLRMSQGASGGPRSDFLDRLFGRLAAGGWHLPTRRRDDAERGGDEVAAAARAAAASARDATASSVAAQRRPQARGEAP